MLNGQSIWQTWKLSKSNKSVEGMASHGLLVGVFQTENCSCFAGCDFLSLPLTLWLLVSRKQKHNESFSPLYKSGNMGGNGVV